MRLKSPQTAADQRVQKFSLHAALTAHREAKAMLKIVMLGAAHAFWLTAAARGVLLLALALIPRVSAAQNANDGFDPNANDPVEALAVQSDGKIVVGGWFTALAPNGGPAVTRNRLARLNVDGSLDAGFAATDVDNVIHAIAIQANGQIVIAGSFGQVGAFARNGIARLNADGSVDTAFDPNVLDGAVFALALQSDGKILVGGSSGQTRKLLARLNADGSLDTSFAAADFDYVSWDEDEAVVWAIAVQANGQIVIGGTFSQVGAFARNNIARLNANGSVDTAFDPNADRDVYALALQPDAKVVVGGLFGSLAPNGGGGVGPSNIARVNADGTVDTAFNPRTNHYITALALQPDGKLVVCGVFTIFASYGGAALTRNHIARLNADGSVDATFDPDPNGYVDALALQPNGQLVVGGNFTSLSPNGGATVARNRIARLNADGSLDTTALFVNPNQHGITGSWFNPATGGQGLELDLYPDLSGAGHGLLFGGWLTYDVAGSGDQRWYALEGGVSSASPSAFLGIYAGLGGNFAAPPIVPATQVGTATLTFASCTGATLAYAFYDGRIGTIPLTRLTANITCGTTSDNGNAASSYLLSGSWSDASLGGQGLVFDVNPTQNSFFAVWYTYAPHGAQTGGAASERWYTIQAAFSPGQTTVADAPIYATAGGIFDDAAVPTISPVGTTTITFTSCRTATLAYSFTAGANAGLSGNINLTRTGPTPSGCTL